MKKNILRAVATAATLGLAVLGIAACSSSGSSSSGSSSGKYVIGYDSYYVGNTWSAQLEAEFKAAAARDKSHISKLIVTESNNSAQKQISNLQSMIARHVDAIIVTPISPSGIAPVLAQAKKAGIKVILNGSNADSKDYTSYVNVDDSAFGATGADWLAKKLDGKGNVLAINGLSGVPTSDIRYKGAQAVFKKYPNIHIVSTIDGQWDEATTKTAVESFLSSNPNIQGVWSQGGSMTLGAIEAFQADNVPLVPMTGEDNNGLLKTWQSLEKSGNTGFDCIGVAKPTSIAATSLDMALKSLEGKTVKKDDIIKPAVITSSNLSTYVRPNLSDNLYVHTDLTDAQIKKLFG